MPRQGLLQRLARRPSTRPLHPGDGSWDDALALALSRLLTCRHGARARQGLHTTALAALTLTDERQLRELCEALARGVTALDPRLTAASATLVACDEAGAVHFVVEARPEGARARCSVRLSPRLPPEIRRTP